VTACRKGHVEPGPHGCRACRREAQRRYERTDKGKATALRYARSEKGKTKRRAVFWRLYQRADRAKFHARFRRYYEENREALLARSKARYHRMKAAFGSVAGIFWRNQVENSR